ncbi:maltase 1-like [Lingula anatina]|uniref:Maltase 1-like n=1 Tax=Lingula anatina TaxID=7574 RepID=A0A1S3KI01_LINAN|nr:maltase 1-like [Lingula anatina]|eukprot:XP_013421851.1 maltase 1-like [Lingula anatina]
MSVRQRQAPTVTSEVCTDQVPEWKPAPRWKKSQPLSAEIWEYVSFISQSVLVTILLGVILVIPRYFVVTFFPVATEPTLEWWQTSIIYQVEPRLFQDSDGDGVGDLKGLTDRLDYFDYIRVNAILLGPVYEHSGSGVTSFTEVAPALGTHQDFKRLIESAHAKGKKIILDFIPNHTSDQHQWFQASRKSSQKYKDFYIWSDGVLLENGKRGPPSDWKDYSCHSAWEWDEERQQFYLHQFSRSLPDLNYRNPDVVAEVTASLRFWLDQGVDGFRLQAVDRLFEHEDLTANIKSEDEMQTPCPSWHHRFLSNITESRAVLDHWRHLLDEYGEKTGQTKILLSDANYEHARSVMALYNSSDMPVNRDFTKVGRSCGGQCIGRIVESWMTTMPVGKWPNWVTSYHGNERMVTRLGRNFATAINMLVMLLPGTPVVYFGDELGQNNAIAGPGGKESPMLWDISENAGFTQSKEKIGHIHPDSQMLSVATQKADDTGKSVLRRFRFLAKTRDQPSFHRGTFKSRLINKHIYSFIRSYESEPSYLVMINFGTEKSSIDFTEEDLRLPSHGVVEVNTGNFENDAFALETRVDFKVIELAPAQGLVIRFYPERQDN